MCSLVERYCKCIKEYHCDKDGCLSMFLFIHLINENCACGGKNVNNLLNDVVIIIPEALIFDPHMPTCREILGSA